MSARSRLLLVLLALTPVVVGFVAWWIETDAEAIERVTGEVRDAFLENDLPGIQSNLMPDAKIDGPAGEEPLVQRFRAALTHFGGRVQEVTLRPVGLDIDGDDARGVWEITTRSPGSGRAFLVRLQARVAYERSPEGWKIRRVAVDTL